MQSMARLTGVGTCGGVATAALTEGTTVKDDGACK
jgi:hypothetical protein